MSLHNMRNLRDQEIIVVQKAFLILLFSNMKMHYDPRCSMHSYFIWSVRNGYNKFSHKET